VIRRGFWLAVGAAGGIYGYRRVSSVARQVSESLGARPNRPAAVQRHWTRETIRFARDMREGMDLYLARHPGPARPTLGESTGNSSTRDDERVDDERVKDDR
jgi:hypothetical protein